MALYMDIETVPVETSGEVALALSPQTAYVYTLTLYDTTRSEGVVYIASQPKDVTSDWKVKWVSEEQLVEDFWQGVQQYDEIFGFGVNQFDIPFLQERSDVLSVKSSPLPTIHDLQKMEGRITHTGKLSSLVDTFTDEGIAREGMVATYSKLHAVITSGDTERLLRHCQHKALATATLFIALAPKWPDTLQY